MILAILSLQLVCKKFVLRLKLTAMPLSSSPHLPISSSALRPELYLLRNLIPLNTMFFSKAYNLLLHRVNNFRITDPKAEPDLFGVF